jgi:mercuric ion binding protein
VRLFGPAMKRILFSNIAFLVFSFGINAQSKSDTTISFQVSGNCDMCKETIEKSLDVKGVKSAIWDEKTHFITVVFNPAKVKEEKLHELIAEAGYDTEKKKGSDKAYEDLPECCHYDRGKLPLKK